MYCFSTVTIFARTRLTVTLYVPCLSGLLIIPFSPTCFGQLFCSSSGTLDCVLQLVVWYTHDAADHRPATSWVHYTTSCNAQSCAPEDGQNNCPKNVELTGITRRGQIWIIICSYLKNAARSVESSNMWKVEALFQGHSRTRCLLLRSFVSCEKDEWSEGAR